MLARLHVLLPYHFTIPDGVSFTTYWQEHRGYRFRFLPPGKSDSSLPPDLPDYKIDGTRCYRGDALTIEFQKENFERGPNTPLDPPVDLIRELILWFLERCRYVLRAAALHAFEFPEETTWRITYVSDDGAELPGGRGALGLDLSFMALPPSVWNDIFKLPADFEPPVWEMLLLDAEASLPTVGSAVTLTATALEVFISRILDDLAAKATLSPTLWAWINDRGFHLKEPSSEEQFDVLLKELLGVSLKSERDLWNGFMNIRAGRNSFVHGGKALIAKKDVTRHEALELIRSARKIIDFVKERLPDELKWPAFQYQFKVTISQVLRRQGDKPEKVPEKLPEKK